MQLFIRWKPPTTASARDFARAQERAPFSYRERGASLEGHPHGYALDQSQVEIGRGEADYAAARRALAEWSMFPRDWVCIETPGRPPRAGDTVAVFVRVFGLWWSNACRVVYVLWEEDGATARSGFAYGTLDAHFESGEERFSVERRADGSVWYVIRAFSRPARLLSRIGYPLARWTQRRFVRASQAAMQEAIKRLRDGRAGGAAPPDGGRDGSREGPPAEAPCEG